MPSVSDVGFGKAVQDMQAVGVSRASARTFKLFAVAAKAVVTVFSRIWIAAGWGIFGVVVFFQCTGLLCSGPWALIPGTEYMSSNNPKNILNVQIRKNSSGHGGPRHGSGRRANFWSTRAPQGPSALHDADPTSTIPSALPSLTSTFVSVSADLGVLQAESEGLSSDRENVFDEGLEVEPMSEGQRSNDEDDAAIAAEQLAVEVPERSILQEWLPSTLQDLNKETEKNTRPKCYKRGQLWIYPEDPLFTLETNRLWLPHLLPSCPAYFNANVAGISLFISTGQLLAFILLAGLGGSAPLAAPEKRGHALAMYSLAPLLGPVVGPRGTFIAEKSTWRWVFWSTALLTTVIQVLGVFIFVNGRTGKVLASPASKFMDSIFKYLKDRNGGAREPEYRIPSKVLGTVAVPVGLFMTGWAVQARVHWIVADI
ncbi:hypothetical protein B0H14DRAFT_3141031, partial [Mycena olivaceomarginata]